jgi:hypothetical protein
MECSQPGAIRDEELIAYLAGEKVRPFVAQHLDQCQRCQQQLATYRQLEFALTSKLYRHDCPPSLVLGEYQLGMLSHEMNMAVENHLSICTLCVTEVATLSKFLVNDTILAERSVISGVSTEAALPSFSGNHRSTKDALKDSLKDVLKDTVQETIGHVDRLRERSNEGVRRIVARLENWLPPPPGLALQRGASSQAALWPRRYLAEDVSISIQVERDLSRRDRMQLIGFVTRDDEVLAALQGMQVVLSSQPDDSSAARIQQTQPIDELGNVVFSSLIPAMYTLELQLPGSIVVIDQFPITLQEL